MITADDVYVRMLACWHDKDQRELGCVAVRKFGSQSSTSSVSQNHVKLVGRVAVLD